MDGELLGAEQLKLSLKTLPDKVANKHMRKALRAGAKVVQSQCVTDAPQRSGKTASAIKVRAGKRKRNVITMMVSLSRDLFPTGLFYVGWVNYGWKWRPHRKTTTIENYQGKESEVHQIPGTRWLNKAFDKAKNAAHEVIASILAKGLEEEAAKARAGSP